MTDDDDAAADHDNHHHEIFSQHRKLPPAWPGRLLANDTAQQFSIDDEDLFCWRPGKMLVKPMLSVICFRMFSWKVCFSRMKGRISRVALNTATKHFRFPLDVQLSLYVSQPYEQQN